MEFVTKLSIQYNFPEWVILLSFLAIVVMVIFTIVLFIKILEPKYKMYRQDMFYGMLWRWKYKGDKIIDLWCYCPTCKSMLHVDDENCKTTSNLGEKVTFFICDKCNESEIGRIKGGNRQYALKVVIREILAKIRLNTFDIYAHK
jgi:predicted RNA-binding Zn-ribbon protein involved in translation (DUF1610 family)